MKFFDEDQMIYMKATIREDHVLEESYFYSMTITSKGVNTVYNEILDLHCH